MVFCMFMRGFPQQWGYDTIWWWINSYTLCHYIHLYPYHLPIIWPSNDQCPIATYVVFLCAHKINAWGYSWIFTSKTGGCFEFLFSAVFGMMSVIDDFFDHGDWNHQPDKMMTDQGGHIFGIPKGWLLVMTLPSGPGWYSGTTIAMKGHRNPSGWPQ